MVGSEAKFAANPFNITKAADFSDQQIEDYWVDVSDGNGFFKTAKPTSPMPMLILGGKGSGKTHLMRYFSYPLQKIRHKENLIEGIADEGYLGIYFRCSGLNSSRFSGKGISEETWETVFSYYMELWLAGLVLELTDDLLKVHSELRAAEDSICDSVLKLFDDTDFSRPNTITDLINVFRELQKRLNTTVNNCAITKSLDIRILVAPGKLTFGVPQAIASNITALRNIQFLYLVDEFENLAKSQQKYINTLYREKEYPASFKIGARLYGVRTFSTFSADEDNKEGSEYEVLYLDDYLRKLSSSYGVFARKLCERRLSEAGYANANIDNFFETFPDAEAQVRYALSKKESEQQPPYFKKLRQKLEKGVSKGLSYDVSSDDEIERIIKNLSVPTNPLLEKANTFLFYQDWYSKKDLVRASNEIASDCMEFMKNPTARNRLQQALAHFKWDLVAQIFRECNQKQVYLGFSTFVEMSDGLPRNLLIVLKHIFKWSVFNDERPFMHGSKISIDSQRRGVKEASEWFYNDARMTGQNAESVRGGVDKLATLFREVRFSDKPSECSISTFSVDRSQLSDLSKHLIQIAENWSLLIRIEGGQRDRNSMRVDAKYQINSMLAPRWDLPTSRRGALALTTTEVNAIFDPAVVNNFDDYLKERVERMMAPGFGRTSKDEEPRDVPDRLPGFDHD
jgi:hypothetical protein